MNKTNFNNISYVNKVGIYLRLSQEDKEKQNDTSESKKYAN